MLFLIQHHAQATKAHISINQSSIISAKQVVVTFSFYIPPARDEDMADRYHFTSQNPIRNTRALPYSTH